MTDFPQQLIGTSNSPHEYATGARGARPTTGPAASAGALISWMSLLASGGIHVRMGFGPEDEANDRGAGYGWQRFVAGLERVAAGLDRQ